MKRYFTRLVFLAACWLSGQSGLQAQFLPGSYTIPQTTVRDNENGTQTVIYSWSPLAANITTVFLLYMPTGGTTWSVASTGGATSPQAANLPVGSYSYAIGLNSASNVVLMNKRNSGISASRRSDSGSADGSGGLSLARMRKIS